MAGVEQRVSSLEEVMKDLAYAQMRSEVRFREFQQEMSEFKDEMKVFKNEMLEFKDEMKVFKNEMLEFKDEMKVFKDEMLEFKDEMRTFNNDSNRRWGDLANKMGTLVEDIVAPNVPGVARRYFGVAELDIMMPMVEKRHPADRSRSREFDVIAAGGGLLFYVDVKSKALSHHAESFLDRAAEVREYFPEYAGLRLVPIYACLRIPEEVTARFSKLGVYCMMMGEDSMEIVNMEAVGKPV